MRVHKIHTQHPLPKFTTKKHYSNAQPKWTKNFNKIISKAVSVRKNRKRNISQSKCDGEIKVGRKAPFMAGYLIVIIMTNHSAISYSSYAGCYTHSFIFSLLWLVHILLYNNNNNRETCLSRSQLVKFILLHNPIFWITLLRVM